MVRAREIFYKVVAKTVLLYGSENWVVTGGVLKEMGCFCHRADRWIIVMTDLRAEDG